MSKAEIDKVDRLVAESEIRNIVAKLGHLADDGDIDEYLSLFTDDATWEQSRGGPVRQGHEDMRVRVLEHRASGVQGPGAATRHVNTTLWVEVDDADHAHAESYWMYLTNANAGTPAGAANLDGSDVPVVQMTGRYRDSFRRTPQGWKMVGRTIVQHVN
jgi:ketosteroid isomerase-like protein